MVVVDSNIIARTERLLLRPLKLEDGEDVVLMRKHPEVMKHTSVLTEVVYDPQSSNKLQSYSSKRRSREDTTMDTRYVTIPHGSRGQY